MSAKPEALLAAAGAAETLVVDRVREHANAIH